MKYFITGGCGFIGSHIVDRLVSKGEVVIYDNLSSGKKAFIEGHLNKKNVTFIKADLLDIDTLRRSIKGCDAVFHLAANPDIRCGVHSPEVDFNQGIVATYNLLEAMRLNNIKNIVFSSSSTVFGEVSIRPTPEDYGPMLPISIYGASKLACEGFIASYCHMFGFKCWIFRFANIIGKRGTHGILVDFIEKLKKDKTRLQIMGNGKQRKSYLLVEDCVDGILYAFNKAKDDVNVFNLASDDDILISKIGELVVKKLGLKKVKLEYTGSDRGWQGDVPLMLLDTKKMKKLGWKTRYSSLEAIDKAIDSLIKERWD
ncbi:MAG: NAD-dependent epimerase/dehydratase family protein [Candidatus Omnitrophota bacterium]